MTSPETKPIAPMIGFVPETVLKRDIFSETVTGHLAGDPPARAALRNLALVPWYARPLSQWLARREARALAAVQGIPGTPVLVRADSTGILRLWSDGTPLQLAKPSDPAFFSDARRLLREMRRRGVTHNDLAKPQNWLMTPEGRAAVIDFQLAAVHRRRGWLFRLQGYEDLRHLLKMKRAFAPQLLTAKELRVVDTRSAPSRLWRATGKRLYNFITRRLMNWSDSEGAGKRLEEGNAAISRVLGNVEAIRGYALYAYPLSGKGVGLYLFVETDLALSAVTALLPEPAPELVQAVARLPREAGGAVRDDLLTLVATNRTDELEAALAREPKIAETMRPIIAGRLNLTDRLL